MVDNCHLFSKFNVYVIFDLGRMLTDGSSKKVSTTSYRRPFGCAGKQ